MLYLISIKALRQKVIFKAIGIYKSLPKKVRSSLIADISPTSVRFVPDADVIILDLSMQLVAFGCVKKLFQDSCV